MPSFSIQWNAYEILQIDKARTRCYGWARSKGRKCENPIALRNREEAQRLLARISKLDPGSSNFDRTLRDLAHALLCQRWHQDQATDVVRKWKDNIDQFMSLEEEEEEEEAEEEEEEEIDEEEEIEEEEGEEDDDLEIQMLADIVRRIIRRRRQQNQRAPNVERANRNATTGYLAAQPTAIQRLTRDNLAALSGATGRDIASVLTAVSSLALQSSGLRTVHRSDPVRRSSLSTTAQVATGTTLPQSPTSSNPALNTTPEETLVPPVSAPAVPNGSQNDIHITNATHSPQGLQVDMSSTRSTSSQGAMEGEPISSFRAEPAHEPLNGGPSTDRPHFDLARLVGEQPQLEDPLPNDLRSLSGDCLTRFDEVLERKGAVSYLTPPKHYFDHQGIKDWLQQGNVRMWPSWYTSCLVCVATWMILALF